MNDSSPPFRSPKEYLGLAVRGFCMGTADIIPGVSSGTMAFILGIYEELILSIRNVGRGEFWQALLRGKFRTACRSIHASFLLAVGSGILFAVLTLSRGLEFMLYHHPVVIWSFFFGLVLASTVVVGKRVSQWTITLFIAVLLGALFAYGIVGLVPLHTPDLSWFLVLSGAIAICATILPGISGAFVLVLLGKYEFILKAINDRDITSIGYVALGAVLGMVLFSQVLSWLLRKYYNLTVAFLTGFMMGSLRKIWPWKIGNSNVIPDIVEGVVPTPEFMTGLGFILCGILIVLIIDRTAKR